MPAPAALVITLWAALSTARGRGKRSRFVSTLSDSLPWSACN